ncbi:nickel-dependent hydrogenase large subunit [Methanogenium cariaci]|uniref:nickel-dependent hydrogenase large subunit n=1 Tax=Methanogenium cariaci TaxID=2197 RepID=UPI001FDEE949|nr:nickel-dependent hydrogenase large subunit [Methanogenium cariaci]
MACDQIFGAQIPNTAKNLRELLMHGQYVHSHSLHFFMLAAPDFLIGHDVPPEERNILSLVKKEPEIAKNAIKVRKFGQRLTEAIGGGNRFIHHLPFRAGCHTRLRKAREPSCLRWQKTLLNS